MAKTKKLSDKAELLKEAIRLFMVHATNRGAVEFEPTDSAKEKIQGIYRRLVHDRLIQPLGKLDVSQKAMRHKLALWASKPLPGEHPSRNGPSSLCSGQLSDRNV